MMHEVAFESVIVGGLDLDRTDTGVVPRRLPADTRDQVTDPMFVMMVTLPAGVRLHFTTTSEWADLEVMLTRLEVDELERRPTAFDVVIDGQLQEPVSTFEGHRIVVSMATGSFDFVTGEATTLRFDLGGVGPKDVEIWLPHGTHTELRALRVDDGAGFGPSTQQRGPRWIHYGSSISHCIEAPRPIETWPAIAARLGGLDLQNLAFAGQCMLDQAVARTIRDLPADLISLKIGINLVNADSMRERAFRSALHGFLDTVRDGHPNTPIVLVSPIACPIVETVPGPTRAGNDGRFVAAPRPSELMDGALTLELIRAIESEIVATRQAAGDGQLTLLDGLQLFGLDEVDDLPDDLHPSPAGYRRIGERFHRLVIATR